MAAPAVLFVGTYTQKLDHVHGKGKGIYSFALDRATGALSPLAVTDTVGHNPSYVTCSASTVYAVNEVGEPSTTGGDKPTGYVKALAIGAGGALRELNTRETVGAYPCHLALSANGAFLTAANYGGGNFSLYAVNADGSLDGASDVHAFTGATQVVADRQEASHVHSTTWLKHADGSEGLIVADLGNDFVAQFVLNKQTKKLDAHAVEPFTKRPPGSGPRHFAVQKTIGVAYVLDELSSTIGVHSIDTKSGALAVEGTQTISMVPADFKGETLGADIHVSTCGNFLYASNRGHDSIACYRIDAANGGALETIGFMPTRGQAPRAFLIDGDLLLAANQNSDTIEVFKIDAESGELVFTGHSVACPTPVSLCLVPSP